MIRVLIVDDSPTMRALLSALLRDEPDIQVIDTAVDANDARAKIRQLDPDVVTLDIEMPGMSGIDFLEKLMRLRPTPVVIVSGLTQQGAEITARALAMGAVDCYAKPRGRPGELLSSDGGRLAHSIRAAAATRGRQIDVRPVRAAITERRGDIALIAIGSSTGGVEALHVLLGSFPADCPPTLVVQHINGHFAGAVARRLDESCAPKVALAETDVKLLPGHVYLAPGNDRHLAVRAGSGLYAKLRASDPVSGHRPSVDVLFHSVAEAVGPAAVGVLLTGMGADGAHGLLAMKRAGATTIAQDEATSTVFGMPRAAIQLGAAGHVAGLGEIAGYALGARG
ncbi:MAG: chemotaxis response regulator protein-glutamate methylesterase [Proteobacteria bacterium SG_bin5]|nr:chemotaxis response regulator protein-glutamate methylesterase [Sphingomonas sp.]OQW44475.1 MAG: chemotaxis response regulator protein-glutamate methylesterase [Proteobacteria bacterium SG_bin5]